MQHTPGRNAHVALTPALAVMSGEAAAVPHPTTAANDEPDSRPLTAEDEARREALRADVRRLSRQLATTDDVTRTGILLDTARAELFTLNTREMRAAGLDPVLASIEVFVGVTVPERVW